MAQPPCSCLLRALVPHIFIVIENFLPLVRVKIRLNQNKKKRESIRLLVHTALIPYIFIIIVDSP